MAEPSLVHDSKFLSLILRHNPAVIELTLDEEGWANVSELLEKLKSRASHWSLDRLEELVFTSDKQRFSFSDDGERIRANQGHSISVDLNLSPVVPPAALYHGTVARLLDSIRQSGLVKGQRHHVHLSVDQATAVKVGQRRGKPIVLTIDSLQMHQAGSTFFCSANGVWLTDHVPTQYIQFPAEMND